MDCHVVTYPEDLAENLRLANELVGQKRNSFVLEKRYVRKCGELIWVRLNGTMVATSSGDPQFLVTVVEDISERRRLGEELEREHRRLQLLLDLYSQFAAKLDIRDLFDTLAGRLCAVEAWEYSTIC